MADLYESKWVVSVDARGVVCRHPSGREDSVLWDDLESVIIETNDSGPWGIDVVWILVGRQNQGGCLIPQGATGDKELLKWFERLPGFNNEQFIAAMCCADNKAFVCWRRPSAT
jgi:hypothetical protein